jgi:mRNA interferase MazF
VRPRRLLTHGEVWFANLDPVVGHEQAGQRPIVIVSSSHFNQNAIGLIVAVPLTRTDRANPLHVAISPPDGGLRYRSFALCDMVRSISHDRLQFFMGRLERDTLDEIADRIRIMLGI